MNNGLCELDLCLIRQNLTCDVSTQNLNSFESFAEPNSTGLAIKKLCYLSFNVGLIQITLNRAKHFF